MEHCQRAVFVKIRVNVVKRKLIFKGFNVKKRVIFILQGLEHIWWYSVSPLFEDASIY